MFYTTWSYHVLPIHLQRPPVAHLAKVEVPHVLGRWIPSDKKRRSTRENAHVQGLKRWPKVWNCTSLMGPEKSLICHWRHKCCNVCHSYWKALPRARQMGCKLVLIFGFRSRYGAGLLPRTAITSSTCNDCGTFLGDNDELDARDSLPCKRYVFQTYVGTQQIGWLLRNNCACMMMT